MTKSMKTAISDEDPLILVDEMDQAIGSLSKRECHMGKGTLHRAFSLFIFNSNGDLLLQQRSTEKPLWPLYWSNSCCSHPRRGESMESATQRRVEEELGFSCELNYLYKFEYRAQYQDVGSEHELCHVFYGFYDGEIKADPDEIADWRFLPIEEVSRELKQNGESYSPWFKMEWETIEQKYLDAILSR